MTPISGSSKADPSKKVAYGELIGGKRFNVTLTGNNVDATSGVAKVKPVQDLRIVGRSPQRYDIPAKVDGSLKWPVDMKVPGMVHARNVKPPVAGAKVIGIDESSVWNLPGFIRVVSKGNYVAAVCEREEQAINASRQLEVTWQKPPPPPFPTSEALSSPTSPPRRCGPGRGIPSSSTRLPARRSAVWAILRCGALSPSRPPRSSRSGWTKRSKSRANRTPSGRPRLRTSCYGAAGPSQD